MSWLSNLSEAWKAILVIVAAAMAGASGSAWMLDRNLVTQNEFDRMTLSVDSLVKKSEFDRGMRTVDSLRTDVTALKSQVGANSTQTAILQQSIRELRDLVEQNRDLSTDVLFNQCLTLSEIRGDANTDRCRRGDR